MDLKKHTWRTAGRPLICSTRGWSDSEVWFDLATEILGRGDFNTKHQALVRMHNGPRGDIRRADGWLDREPTEQELCSIMDHVCSLNVHCKDARGVVACVTPHLLRDARGQIPHYTPHSLKKAKISAYVALRLHPDYAVEAGAHAGSTLERLSVSGAESLAQQIRPQGLAVALRYARAARDQSVLEIDALVAKTVREWIIDTTLAKVPRHGGWASLTRWASLRAARNE